MTTEQQLQQAREHLKELKSRQFRRMTTQAQNAFDKNYSDAQQAVIDLEQQLSEEKSRTLMGAIGK